VSLAVGDRVGRFRVEEPLSDSDMSQVFKAVSEPDGELVALKIVHPYIHDEEALRRFEREARIARRAEHPNLIPVLETGHVGDAPYLVMRYVPGRTVALLIKASGPLPFDGIVRLIGEVGAALDALHGEGVVHRDVLPSNVLVDERGTAFLTDFGFARSHADRRITELDRPVGALDYRAPELFRNRPAGRASDIYSLGCLAYECLVGIPPFGDRDDLVELGEAHLTAPPPDPSRRRPDVPPDLASGVLTALAKEPERRPPSGAAFAKLLRLGLPRSG
jgi:serine/threonine protein kinase